ncbi:nuclear transport factor 2 family protein [Cryptosporangium sp. NPDC048952]|uniref:nuclear transport factor 2 family protein n=1 Tax=Cryptosporangium sp. NPDC048952 TaxID=3363961 RepID=UPI00371A5433
MSDPVVHADATTRAEILAVEERRRTALLDVDLEVLDDLYDETLIHTHAPGVTHDKTQLLEHVATRQAYLDITRGELTIRTIGDVAIVTGRIRNRLSSPDGTERVLGGQVIQVLRRCEDGAWRFVSFQMTPDGEHVWPATAAEQASIADTAITQKGAAK